jgi:hypothetical protein
MRFLYREGASAVEFLCGSGPVSGAMKSARRNFRRPAERAARLAIRRHHVPAARGVPAFGEVLAEIGLILAIHLGVALAVTLTLRASGIV